MAVHQVLPEKRELLLIDLVDQQKFAVLVFSALKLKEVSFLSLKSDGAPLLNHVDLLDHPFELGDHLFLKPHFKTQILNRNISVQTVEKLLGSKDRSGLL
jgi:hypothetical protein